ncbi:LysR family transcriptional regulator, partial [Klebsiella michiganensis]|uniref:LysR family transcriptional regulator n=1 Tax=Klebsiella michiganensis TaxID=1134687 RepID=UPI00178373A2
MNLKQLYYFKRLAETEHYTEAASSLFITQPSLSHAITELEKELGVALSTRKGRNVKITQNGKRFLPYVEDALASLENDRMTLQKNSDENKENIRIAFIYTMGEHVVPQLIHKYS